MYKPSDGRHTEENGIIEARKHDCADMNPCCTTGSKQALQRYQRYQMQAKENNSSTTSAIQK
jgi:hypothetical protein